MSLRDDCIAAADYADRSVMGVDTAPIVDAVLAVVADAQLADLIADRDRWMAEARTTAKYDPETDSCCRQGVVYTRAFSLDHPLPTQVTE